MLALKSGAAAFLAVLVLAVLTPSFLLQDAGPGKPDDVAQLLPEETIGFVELVKAPRLLHDWKEYVGSVATEDGKDKLCAVIDEWFTKALEIVPEKILKDLKEGLPSIQRMAVALTGIPDADPDIPWAFIATSSDPAFFKKLVEEDLSVFAAEERKHNGVRVFAIRKMGELKSDSPVYVAAPGARLVLTTRWASLTDMLDRAAGRGTGGDLRSNRLYAQLAPAASDDPSLRAFCRWDWDLLTGAAMSPFSSRRYNQFHMDMMDAVFGYRKMSGSIVEATFKPGRVASTMRMQVDSPCRLYDALRQPAGPKDLLANLPKKTAIFAHQNLKGGKEVWAEVEAFMRRFQEVERKARAGREVALAGAPADDAPGDYVAEMDKFMKDEVGFAPRDAAALIGNEILAAFVDPGEIRGFEQTIVVLARTTDPAKAKELMAKAASKSEGYTTVTEDGITLFKPTHPHQPCFGIRDTVVALGFQDSVVKGALASKEDASGALKRLPKEAATASGVLGLNPGAAIDLILALIGTDKPESLKHLRSDDWSVTLSRMEKDQIVMSSADSGAGVLIQAGFSFVPLTMIVLRSVMVAGIGMPEAEPAAAPAGEKPPPEPAPLAADALAKKTAELIPLLRSDELTVREKASTDLKALGRQALPLLIAAFKEEKDPEAKSRLTSLLVDHAAWDALPELLDRKVDAFFDEFKAAIETKDEDNWWGGYATWNGPDSNEPFSMEPMIHSAFTAALKNGDLVSNPGGLKRFAERLRKSDIAAPKRAQYAAVLAYNDCGPAFESVLEMRDVATDAESRGYFTAALGWSDDAKAREAVGKSLESKEVAIRRGAFIAAERSRDPEIVARLLDRTKDADFETRWNAGFTLRVVTKGKIEVNAFLPDAELEAQVQAARKWWTENKAGFKPAR